MIHTLVPLAGAKGQGFEDSEQILLHRKLAEYGGLLRQVADASTRTLVHRQFGNVIIVEKHAPRIRADKADDHVERSCLSRSVRPEKSDHLSVVNTDRDIIHHPPATIR